MDALDRALCRAHEIFLGDLSDETDNELAKLLPMLVEAGYTSRNAALTDRIVLGPLRPPGLSAAKSSACSDSN